MIPMVVKGKNMEVAEPLQRYVEKKLGKLDRYLGKITAMTVELATEPSRAAEDRQVVEATILVNGQILRAEEKSSDMFASIDAVADKLERSIERYKAKLYRKPDIRKNRRQIARAASAEENVPEVPPAPAEGQPSIVRTKRFQIKPMSAEEAVDQMEMLGHDFYVFHNLDTAGVNVVYRRSDGTYGLLVPELA